MIDYDVFSPEIGLNAFCQKGQEAQFSDYLQDPPATENLIDGSLSASSILDGETTALSSVAKKTFNDTTSGKIEGLDTDGTYKWIIGDASSGVDWNVTTDNTLTVKGTITALSGAIGGWTINTSSLTDTAGTVGMSSAVTAGDDIRFWAGDATPGSAEFRVYESGALVASSATITGAITATSGTIGSFTIGTYLYTGTKTAYNDANAGVHIGGDGIGFGNNVFTVSAAGDVVATSLTLTGGTIKYGKTTFADSTNAGYYISSDGVYFGAAADATLLKYAIATGLIDLVGTISSRSTATIAAAINSSGNLVNDVINLRLDTSAKSILSDFEFNSTDYSGGLKCGTITWNATTGAITGGSGGVFHKGGIVFANAGVATITLDGATGAATFAGSLSAPSGNIGGFTIGATTLTGGTTNIILDSSNKAISINDATFGNLGIQLQYNAGTPRAYIGNGTNQYFQFDGTNVEINGTQLLFQSIYGDGSDGDVTISSNTNLTRDMYYDNLTITGSSIWLNPNGYRIFVKGTLTINSTCRIQRDGNGGGNGTNASGATAGMGGTAGAALAAGSIPGSVAGIVGANGGNGGSSSSGFSGGTGGNGNSVAKSVGSAGADGVDGGKGGNSGRGSGYIGGAKGENGTGGTQTGTVYNTIKNVYSAFLFSDTQSSTLTNYTGSAGTAASGGGGGGGGYPAEGVGGGGGGAGGSGSSGGIILVFVRNIVLNGDITSYGGTGGNGGNGAAGVGASPGGGGGGGGGCGGTGGVCVVVYNKKTGAGTIVAPGGKGGSEGNGGTGGGTGQTGDNGIVGSSGNAGQVITLQV